MQVNDSRPLKATNKSNRRLEISLIIVIVVSFTWSAYALYKVALGNADTSIFGFNIARSAPSSSASAQPGKGQSAGGGTNQLQAVGNMSASDQLALYKSEILKELLARQRELLGAASAQRGAQSAAAATTAAQMLLSPKDLMGQLREHQQLQRQQVDFNQLNQWRGGFSLPSSLDYLSNSNQKLAISAARQLARAGNNSSPVNHRLQSLENAPSLGQLSSRANRLAQLKSTLNQPPEQVADEETEPDQANERRPEESSLSEEIAAETTTARSVARELDRDEGADEDAARLAETTTTTTTTESPPSSEELSETTTVEPAAVASASEPDEEPAGNQDEVSDDSADEGNESSQRAKEERQQAAQSDEEDAADDRGSLERARKAVNAIDEEVDRMTQPSVGSISRRHRDKQHSTPDYRGVVHFDDSLSGAEQERHRRPNATSSRRAQLNRAKIASSAGDQDPLQAADLTRKPPIFHSNYTALTDLDRPSERSKLKRTNDRRSKREARTNGTSETGAGPWAARLAQKQIGKRNDLSSDEEDEGQEEETLPNEDGRPAVQVAQQQGAAKVPSLQELLDHKQLLDALKQTRAVAPDFFGSSAPANGSNQVQAAGASQGLVDHKPAADTSYTLDEGLLLTPASDDEHDHKTMSKKKMKKQEKKAKKKLTMAVKKGGHKKKKHKKEEKKYMKEKKFKGAKKGKKMSKGKGGKGGKKGSKFFKDKGFKKKGFKNVYVKNEFGQKKSYFDEFRDKNFKKKWKNFDDKYNYAQMKKWQAKDVKGAKKMKDQGEKFKKYDKGKWKKKYHKHQESESSKKKKKYDHF